MLLIRKEIFLATIFIFLSHKFATNKCNKLKHDKLIENIQIYNFEHNQDIPSLIYIT